MGKTYSTATGSLALGKSATPAATEEPNSSANHATTGGRPTGRPLEIGHLPEALWRGGP
jgi:hypothetical protein